MQKDNINNDFVYLELAKWNENFVEKIQKDKNEGRFEKNMGDNERKGIFKL